MAQIRETKLVDDLDGGPADETVQWALDGKSYEIDLSTAHAEMFRKLLGEYVAVARRATDRRQSRTATSSSDREYNQRARTWLRGQGIKVAERGRIPVTYKMAYDAGRPELAKG